MKTIKVSRADAIEQIALSLGALPMPANWNLAAVAEAIANDLVRLTDNQAKRKLLGVKNR